MEIKGYGLNNKTWDYLRETSTNIPNEILNIGNALEDIFMEKNQITVNIVQIEKRLNPVYGYKATYEISYDFSNLLTTNVVTYESMLDACNSLESDKCKIIFSNGNNKIIVNLKY